MPQRKVPIVSGETYHVFNKSIEERPAFNNKREYSRAIKVLSYYRFIAPPRRLSRFLLMNKEKRESLLHTLFISPKLVDVFCFCFMPNHFHFLLKQEVDSGVSKFISQFVNSYTRYFNTRNDRVGPLFLDQFKAVRIENDDQFIHVSRYIHLNPHTSFIVKSYEDLERYPWSSLPDYCGSIKSSICNTDPLTDFFKTPERYKQFLANQADYQRELGKIKHLLLDSRN